MQGMSPFDNPEGIGLIPRTLQYLFQRIQQDTTATYSVRCSYVEIYNETIYDLLDSVGRVCGLREDSQRGVYISDCTLALLSSPSEALDLFNFGAQNRHVAATSMNRESSRSHSVFTLFLHRSTVNEETELVDVRESKFNLVDLAGSERQQLTGAVGQRLKEAGSINKSLLTLSNVINALVETASGRPRHVHYRDSKLTFLLRDSLGGNSKTCIVANVSPSPFSQAETLSTLRFAQRAKLIKNQAIVNMDLHGDVSQLQAEIRRLRQQLSNTEGSSRTVLDEGALMMAMQRQTELSNQVMKLKEALETSEELCRLKDQHILGERLLRKLREDNKQYTVHKEVECLRRMLEHHPDVVRFAMDNTRLRERLGQLDPLTIDDFDGLQTQIHRQQSHIDYLTARLTNDSIDDEHQIKKRRTEEVEHARVVEELEAERDTLKARIGDLENEEVLLQQRLANETSLNGELNQRLIESSQKLNQKLNELNQKGNETVGMLEKQMADLTEERDHLRRELSDAHSKCLDLSSQLAKLGQSYDLLDKEKRQAEDVLLSLEDQYKARLAQSIASTALQIDQLTRLHQSKMENIQLEHAHKIKALQDEHGAHVQSLQEQIGRLDQSLRQTKNNLSAVTAELDTQRAKSIQLASDLQQKNETRPVQPVERISADEMYVLKMELAHLRKQSALYMERIKELESTNALQVQEKCTTVDETRYKLVMAENAQLQARIAKLESLLTDSSTDVLSTRLATLEQSYEALLREKENLLSHSAALQEDNAKLVAHHNAKQKLHYHVKIKEENNALKQENMALKQELAKNNT